MSKEKVYLRCTGADQKAIEIKGTPDIGVEYLGNCSGHAITESGEVAGIHWSSTLDFLRSDLKRNIDESKYEIIDMIDQDVAAIQEKQAAVEDLKATIDRRHTAEEDLKAAMVACEEVLIKLSIALKAAKGDE